MPVYEDLKPHPRSYLADTDEGVWPKDPLADDAPPEALLAHHICTTLEKHGLTSRPLAQALKISQRAANQLLNGSVWPSLAAIVRIEQNLGIPLWIGQYHNKRGTPLEPRPNCYLRSGEWPTGLLKSKPPPEAVLAQKISHSFSGSYSARPKLAPPRRALTGRHRRPARRIHLARPRDHRPPRTRLQARDVALVVSTLAGRWCRLIGLDSAGH